MVKSVLGVKHQGLRDWAFQRITAIFMAVYSIGLISYLVLNPGLSFAEWHYLFSHAWMKIATILFISCILVHAWLGMWIVFTDYVKPFVLRCILDVLILLMFLACFFWGILILWSV